MLPGETLLSGAPAECPDCKKHVRLGYMQSAAGWYYGSWCNCGPYSRESEYYPTYQAVKKAYEQDKNLRLRS